MSAGFRASPHNSAAVLETFWRRHRDKRADATPRFSTRSAVRLTHAVLVIDDRNEGLASSDEVVNHACPSGSFLGRRRARRSPPIDVARQG